ncbi:MAG: hypothetical protein GY839_18825 [candidate division Zixibacteria bacterium]|nr:hypothetical protein [candidate division Zixibacteria bacterium]
MAVKTKRKCKTKGCKAHPLRNGDHCYQHDPERTQERQKARSQGGKTTMTPKTLANAKYKLDTITEVKKMLGDITNASLRGDIDISRTQTAGYLASLIISCIKDHDLEKRMEQIEEILKSKAGN